jgi:AcrR family transcriptional regulator
MAATRKVDGRRERSRLTRGRVVGAAARLFVEHGYVATTIEHVAEDAGVAVQTVYYIFGTKRNLLAAVLDASVAGDVEPVPVLERDWVEALRAEQDATSAVERLVDATVAIVARTMAIYEVVRRGAGDPEVSALLDEVRSRRRADQRALIEILWRSGHLHPRVDADIAADVLYGLINEEVLQLFTVDCGWEVEQFRSWATSLMLQQLVDANGSAA